MSTPTSSAGNSPPPVHFANENTTHNEQNESPTPSTTSNISNISSTTTMKKTHQQQETNSKSTISSKQQQFKPQQFINQNPHQQQHLKNPHQQQQTQQQPQQQSSHQQLVLNTRPYPTPNVMKFQLSKEFLNSYSEEIIEKLPKEVKNFHDGKTKKLPKQVYDYLFEKQLKIANKLHTKPFQLHLESFELNRYSPLQPAYDLYADPIVMKDLHKVSFLPPLNIFHQTTTNQQQLQQHHQILTGGAATPNTINNDLIRNTSDEAIIPTNTNITNMNIDHSVVSTPHNPLQHSSHAFTPLNQPQSTNTNTTSTTTTTTSSTISHPTSSPYGSFSVNPTKTLEIMWIVMQRVHDDGWLPRESVIKSYVKRIFKESTDLRVKIQWHFPGIRQLLFDMLERVAPKLFAIEGSHPNRLFWPLETAQHRISWNGLDVSESVTKAFEEELDLRLCIAWIMENGALLEALETHSASLLKTHFALQFTFKRKDILQPPAHIFARTPAQLSYLLFRVWHQFGSTIKRILTNK